MTGASPGTGVTFDLTRFHTGGSVHADSAGSRVVHQMYVERIRRTGPAPSARIVLVHGTDQTGLCFLSTADGRPGWAYDFARLGWDVYTVDQVARGRSAYDPAVHGALARLPVQELEALFTGAAEHGRFAGSEKHKRWPTGPGVAGNAAFDSFAASQVASMSDLALAEELNTAALGELLHRIGGGVLLTHSQASAFGFQLCDRAPGLVDAHVTVEPHGPPFFDVTHVGPPEWHAHSSEISRPWGITRLPLRYQPPAGAASELNPVWAPATEPDAPGGWLQPEPARTLPRLARTPHAVVTAAASYRTHLDPQTVRYLIQAGVPASHLRLADHGIQGNGHMMMLEDNSAVIARLLSDWALPHAGRGRQPRDDRVARATGAAPAPLPPAHSPVQKGA